MDYCPDMDDLLDELEETIITHKVNQLDSKISIKENIEEIIANIVIDRHLPNYKATTKTLIDYEKLSLKSTIVSSFCKPQNNLMEHLEINNAESPIIDNNNTLVKNVESVCQERKEQLLCDEEKQSLTTVNETTNSFIGALQLNNDHMHKITQIDVTNSVVESLTEEELETLKKLEEEVASLDKPEQTEILDTITDTKSTYLNNTPSTSKQVCLQTNIKPHWIPDNDCSTCMLCSNKFTLVNRRHHCRSCGRVLCNKCCCQTRRLLPYQIETEAKQRVCTPCNKTLDRIQEYNKYISELNTSKESYNGENNENLLESASTSTPRKKSVLKIRSSMEGEVVNCDHNSDFNISNNATSKDFTQNTLIMNNSMLKRNVTFRDGIRPGDEIGDSKNFDDKIIDKQDENIQEQHKKKVCIF